VSSPRLGAEALVAILRGVTPKQVLAVGETLYAAGFRRIEIPLNSPDPFTSIKVLADRSFKGLIVGAGTVLNAEHVRRTKEAGGCLIVAPNCDPEVIRSALGQAMQVMPGVATATELFQAIAAGATELKLFPAATYGPGHLQALRAVLPQGIAIYPVGGVTAQSIAAWLAAGAAGFGFGSELFKPDYTLDEIARRAASLLDALRAAQDQTRNH
jgi:2-dehydro-3-deoxyphosphogalactonate aldolase